MTVTLKCKINDLEPVIKRLNEARTVVENRVQYAGFVHLECMSFIYKCLKFHPELSDNDARSLLNTASLRDTSSDVLTTEQLIKEVNKLETEFLARKPANYLVWTSVSLSRYTHPFCIKTTEAEIEFSRSPLSMYKEALAKLEWEIKETLPSPPPKDYLYVIVKTTAKSPGSAIGKAFDSLNFVRGAWNLQINSRKGLTMSFGLRRKPFNSILLGPLHTCHNEDGSLATENFWYEPSYIKPLSTFDFGTIENHADETINAIHQQTSTKEFGEFIRKSIIHYTLALDESDLNNCFLKLWGLLERLTLLSSNEKSDKLISRLAFLHEDNEDVSRTLKHLREYRNSYVHETIADDEFDVGLHQLRNFVESALIFYIRNRYNFSSLEEMKRFLDMPTDKNEIANLEKLIEMTKKFRRLN